MVEIIHEGKWRTNALDVRKWLRENLVRRVNRSASGAVEDYDSTGKRRPGGPKFDNRNGALTEFGTRPYAEFAVLCGDGDTVDPEDVIEGQLERKRLQTASEDADYNLVVMPADRESKRLLGRNTLSDWVEQGRCVLHLELLQRNRPVFDAFLAQTISEQQVLSKRVGLDHDESEALAVITLLWATGPRAYLNYLDTGNKRRLRNAFDRLNRKLQNSDWAMALRKTLKEQARNKRYFYPEEPPARVRTSKPSRPRVGTGEVGSRGAYGLPAELTLRWHTRDDRAKGLLFPPSKETLPDTDAEEVVRLVDLGCDLTPQQRALYRSSSLKPKPRRKTKLYSE